MCVHLLTLKTLRHRWLTTLDNTIKYLSFLFQTYLSVCNNFPSHGNWSFLSYNHYTPLYLSQLMFSHFHWPPRAFIAWNHVTRLLVHRTQETLGFHYLSGFPFKVFYMQLTSGSIMHLVYIRTRESTSAAWTKTKTDAPSTKHGSTTSRRLGKVPLHLLFCN